MKLASVAIAAALASAPIAHAQVTCTDVSRIVAAAGEDFESLAGDEIDDELYKSTYLIAGANDCSVDLFLDAIHSCIWNFPSQADAIQAYNTNVAAIAPCLSAWKASAMKIEADPVDGSRLVAGMSYVGSGDFEFLEWVIVLEEVISGKPTPYRLWVELVYS
jgi:hypothetical protein